MDTAPFNDCPCYTSSAMNPVQIIKTFLDPSSYGLGHYPWDITPQKVIAWQTVNGAPGKHIHSMDISHEQFCIEPHRLMWNPRDVEKRYIPPPTGRYDTNAGIRGQPLPFDPQTMEFSKEFIEDFCTMCADLPPQDDDGFSWEEAYHAHISGEVPFDYMDVETIEAIDRHLRQVHGPQLAEGVGLDYATARWISEQNMMRLCDNQIRSIMGDPLEPYLPMGYAFFASKEMVTHAIRNGRKAPMLIVQLSAVDPAMRLLLVDADTR